MSVVDDLLRVQIAQYAGASGDFHPFHVDDVHARANGFDGVFAHGMLTMGLTGRVLSLLAGDAAIKNYRAQLRRQIWPGDSLVARAVVCEVTAQDDLATLVTVELETCTQDGVAVLTGSATLVLESGDLSHVTDVTSVTAER